MDNREVEMAKRNIGAMLFNSKIISVLLAVLLWVYVVGIRGPDTTKSVEAQLMAANVPQGYVLVGTLPTVTVTLRGPMNTLWNVTSGYVTPTVVAGGNRGILHHIGSSSGRWTYGRDSRDYCSQGS